jgi:hypothetical protein
VTPAALDFASSRSSSPSSDDDISTSTESTGVKNDSNTTDANDNAFDTDDDHSQSSGVSHTESPGVYPIETPGVHEPGEPLTEYERFLHATEQGRQAADNAVPSERPKRSTRSNHQDAYVYMTALIDCFEPDRHQDLFTLITAQMTAKKGVAQFGEAGKDAIAKELKQLLNRNVLHGVQASGLTNEQRKAALRYLMFLKEKRTGEIKGRGCADGRKQRLYKTKAETSSPTVSTEALFLSCLIDAVEGRHVIVCDIPGAFMQADIDELVHVKLDGTILEVLLRIDPAYERFVTYEGKNKVLYTQLDKALYGTVQAAYLFWKKLSLFLTEKLGFTINPYDFCVANKTSNGKQFTIAWYVDDLKLSHKDANVVEDILRELNKTFGVEAPLTVSRGKQHEYLGMKINYSVDGKVIFSMPDLTKEVLKQIPKDLQTGPSSTPAANHLFQVNRSAAKLNTENKDLFHRMTAQLLYLSKRARPDLQTAVSFLTTRVQQPDTDDWKKLGRCVRYLRRTKHYALTLEAESMCHPKWWVHASYGIHPGLKSHTGVPYPGVNVNSRNEVDCIKIMITRLF